MSKIYVSYSNPQDHYAVDMIKGKIAFDAESKMDIITNNHLLSQCQKALFLLSEPVDWDKVKQDYTKLTMTNIPIYLTKIHNDQQLKPPETLSDLVIQDWSLDDILRFCA